MEIEEIEEVEEMPEVASGYFNPVEEAVSPVLVFLFNIWEAFCVYLIFIQCTFLLTKLIFLNAIPCRSKC